MDRVQLARAVYAIGASSALLAIVLLGAGPLGGPLAQTRGEPIGEPRPTDTGEQIAGRQRPVLAGSMFPLNSITTGTGDRPRQPMFLLPDPRLAEGDSSPR